MFSEFKNVNRMYFLKLLKIKQKKTRDQKLSIKQKIRSETN